MKNLEILSEQEMRAIDGGGFVSSITTTLVNAVGSVAAAIQTGILLVGSFFSFSWW
jgi:phage-related minor tail protein